MHIKTNVSVLIIALVEDDAEDRLFFKEAIEKLNIPHRILFAKDCFELYSLLESDEMIDLIFMDIKLPVIDGKECLKTIKANAKHRHIPVIIFSGLKFKEDIDFCYAHGAHYYVVKPYASINYLAAIRVVMKINWKEKQALPSRENFLVNLSFS